MTELERKITTKIRGLHTLAVNEMWTEVREEIEEISGLLEYVRTKS